jgi:glycerol-3-phosphate acyltransferase PlsY
MLVVLYPLIALPLAVVWGVLAKVLHKASLATLPVVIAFPVLVALAGYDTWEIVTVSAIAALLVIRHAANIRRLLKREEITLIAPDEQQRRAS